MAVKRGVMFEIQTSLSPDVDKAFTAMEKRIDALQGKMRVTFGGGFGGGGNGYSYGNGNGGNGSHAGTGGGHFGGTRDTEVERRKAEAKKLDEFIEKTARKQAEREEREQEKITKARERQRANEEKAAQRAAAEAEKAAKKKADVEQKEIARIAKDREKALQASLNAEKKFWDEAISEAKRGAKERARVVAQAEKDTAKGRRLGWNGLSDIGRSALGGGMDIGALSDVGREALRNTGAGKFAEGLKNISDQRRASSGWAGMSALGKDAAEKHAAHLQDSERERAAENKAGQRHAKEREREQERASRAAELAAGRQRESQHRLGISIGQTTDALTRLGEGFSYLGLIGQRDLGQLSDSLLRIRGIAESVRGISGLLRGTGGDGGGGIGGLLRGGAGRLGMGALASPAGLAGVGGAAALALLANMGTGGRFTNAGGRFIARAGIGTSQHLHNFGNMLETFGMDEAERGQVNYRRATQMEDVNNPSGFGLGMLLSAPGAAMTGNYSYRSGLGHDIDAAAAAARNTARLQALNSQQAQQRSVFQRLTNAELGGELSISGIQRERENAQADIDRERRMAYFHMNSTPYFLGSTRGKGAAKLNYRTQGHTGIGASAEDLGLDYAPGVFREGGFFSNARGIHDTGQRMRFLQERRDKNAEAAGEQRRIKQRMASLDSDRGRTQTEAIKLQMARDLGTGYNPEGEQQAAERLKQIDQERAQLMRESDQLHRQMREQDIQDAAKLLEFAKQNADVAKGKLNSAVGAKTNLREQLGAMNPMQVANLVQARKRAEAGEELSIDQMNVLANAPDERSRTLGRQALQRRGDAQLEAAGGAGLIGSQEEFNMATAQRQAATAYERLGEGEKELRGVTNQVVVGGDYHVTVDIRDDMGLAEQMHEHQASIEQQFREHDQKIISAVRAMISESMRNVHEQGKVTAGS